jgi:ABC-type amino acid transport substrate-binding protein
VDLCDFDTHEIGPVAAAVAISAGKSGDEVEFGCVGWNVILERVEPVEFGFVGLLPALQQEVVGLVLATLARERKADLIYVGWKSGVVGFGWIGAAIGWVVVLVVALLSVTAVVGADELLVNSAAAEPLDETSHSLEAVVLFLLLEQLP